MLAAECREEDIRTVCKEGHKTSDAEDRGSSSICHLPSSLVLVGPWWCCKTSLTIKVKFNISQKRNSEVIFSFSIGMLNWEKSSKSCCAPADSKVISLLSARKQGTSEALGHKHKSMMGDNIMGWTQRMRKKHVELENDQAFQDNNKKNSRGKS